MARLLHSKNCVFVPFATTGNDVYDQSGAVPLKWLNSFTTSREQTDLEWLGDGTFEEKSSKLDSIEVSMTFSTSMAVETVAKLTGLEIVKGRILTSPNAIAIRGALLWEDVYSDGINDRLAFYNVSLTLTEVPRETDSDGSDSLYTFEGFAIPYEITKGDLAGKTEIQSQISQRYINGLTGQDQTDAQKVFDEWYTEVNKALIPA